MASGGTGAPVLILDIVEWHVPATELHGGGDQLGIVGCMDIMTGGAVPSLFLVDMYVVKIPVSFTEFGTHIGGLYIQQVGIMAIEAEGEILLHPFNVGAQGKFILEHQVPIGEMRIVAAGTPFVEGLVKEGTLIQVLLYIGQKGTVLFLNDLIMAVQAQLLALVP